MYGNTLKECVNFCKREAVLVAAVILAAGSSIAVRPDQEYLGYIDFRTLAILFCLMAVMAGLQETGLFTWTAQMLLKKVKSMFQLIAVLVLLCFFSSMLITNDVALITFVPFTFIVLSLLGEESRRLLCVPVVVFQTIGANLGSMLTPIGNPQNLYLYDKAGLGTVEFMKLMLPYTVISLILLTGCCLWQGRRSGRENTVAVSFSREVSLRGKEHKLCMYLLLFLVCLMTVARAVPFQAACVTVVICVLLWDRKVFRKVDYSLLLTFAGFFIFIGNMGRIPAFRFFLERITEGNEIAVSVAASQIISNVPAALLLSGFTENIRGLIVGTNLGGLGTLIASMASLISYKYLCREQGSLKKKYFMFFTCVNFCFLIVLLLSAAVL